MRFARLLLLLRKCKHHVRAGCGWGERTETSRLVQLAARDAEHDIFLSRNLVNGRHAFRDVWQIEFPKQLAVVLIIGMELAVRRCREQNHTAGHDDTAS